MYAIQVISSFLLHSVTDYGDYLVGKTVRASKILDIAPNRVTSDRILFNIRMDNIVQPEAF